VQSGISMSDIIEKKRVIKPKWLRVKLPTGKNYKDVRKLVDNYELNTICQSGNCPNMGECWGEGTATFMILGNICTRSCGFCNVATGRPLSVDWDEPDRVALSVKQMKVKHAVLTSVDRDDLADGGSIIWAETVNAIKRMSPGTTMETLIPDFKGNYRNIQRIIDVAPEVVSHNLETVKRLSRKVRIQARYEQSLEVLKFLKESGLPRTKSGIMLGLGESIDEVLEAMEDLVASKVDILTIGQYLQPTKSHLSVVRYVEPKVFDELKTKGLKMGFRYVESGPLVRSSYHAERHLI